MLLVDLALRTAKCSGPQASYGYWVYGMLAWCWRYLAYCGSRAGSPVDGWTLKVRSVWLITERNTGPLVMP